MDELFDEAGNLITERPKSDKIDLIPEKTFKCRYCEFEYDSKSARAGHERWCDNNLESKKIDLIPEKEIFYCQFCEQEWDNDRSKIQHERWCSKNPNPRQYRKIKTEVKKLEKKKAKIKPEIITLKGIDIIKELREFDKVFGLTDEQIIKYIRDKMKNDEM